MDLALVTLYPAGIGQNGSIFRQMYENIFLKDKLRILVGIALLFKVVHIRRQINFFIRNF